MILLLILLVVFRSSTVGTDTLDYIYDISSGVYTFNIQNTIDYYFGTDAFTLKSASTVASREFVFSAIVSLLLWLGFSPFFCMKLLSICIILMCYKSLKLYLPKKYVIYGIIIYVTSFLYFTHFNTLRQSLACSFFFLSTAYVYRGLKFDKLKALFLCILAFFSHTSTIIPVVLLPIVFIKLDDSRRIKTMMVILLLLLFVEALDSQMGILDGLFNQLTAMELLYSNQMENYSMNNVSMSSIEKGFTLLFHGILIFLFYWTVKEKKERRNIVVENIWFVGFALFLLLSKSPIFARITEYYLMFQLITIPYAIKVSKDSGRFDLPTRVMVYSSLFITYWYYLQAHWYGVIPYETV